MNPDIAAPEPGGDNPLSRLVESALARPAGERSAFLEKVRESDPELYREAVSRIESEEHTAAMFGNHPIWSDDPLPPNPLGASVAHYRILKKLGAGGMGVVYQAEDTKLERIVALKFLPSASMAEAARRRFLQEARAAARVQHPNICPVFEIGEHKGQLYFAMALVEGRTIAELTAHGPLTFGTALDLAIGIAGGLAAAHREGIVHRDIKSGNIIVDRNGHPFILDFGIALKPDAERVTEPGGTMGTPAYMSPEQAQGLPLDHRTDIWSLGIVLFEMLTGQLPFRRDSQFSELYAIVKEPAPAIRSLRPGLPKELDAVLDKALAKDPGERWQSCSELASVLRGIRETESRETGSRESESRLTGTMLPPLAATASLRLPVFETPRPRRWRLGLAVLLALAAALGGLGVWFYGSALPEQKQIAVLPFEITGNQNDDTIRSLADGLAETLTAKLSQVEDFQGKILVIPASEIRSAKITTAAAAHQIYNANLVFMGSAERLGDVIELNQVLVNTSTPPRQMGARTLRFRLNDPIAARDQAVAQAVELLALKITPLTAKALTAGETSTSAAYAEYLRGVGYLARYDVPGNVDMAISHLDSATLQDTHYALAWAALGDAHWRKAKQSHEKKDADLALENIHEALRIDPRLAAAHIKLGEIYSESGQAELAIAEEQSALRIAPGNAQAYRALGAAYTATSRFAEAEAAYRQGIAHQPSDWYGHLLLGYFYSQRGQLADARSAFEAARRLTPDNEVVYSNLATLDMYQGKFQDALDLCSNALKFERGARTWSAIGLANYYLRRFADAAKALDKSTELDESVYQVWGNRGTVYRHIPGGESKARGSFLKAIELARRTLQVQQGDFRAHANLAEYDAKLGLNREARAEIDQIPPSAREPYLDRIVLVEEFGGDRAGAIETVLSLKPDSPAFNFLKNDPDLDALWRDVAARPH